MSNDEWMRSSEAQSYLGRTDRQLRRYVSSGRVRSRTRGGRVEYNRADLDTLRGELKEDPRPQAPDQQIVPAGELLGYIRELQEIVSNSAAREGYLRAQLEQRLALPDERALRDELAAERQLRIDAEASLKRLQRQRWQGWTLAIVVAIVLLVAIIWYFAIR